MIKVPEPAPLAPVRQAYFFGHYDSRGGATLVLASSNFVKAP